MQKKIFFTDLPTLFFWGPLQETNIIFGLALTLTMLRLLSSKAQKCKNSWKPPKPCHIGTHLIALTEHFQMSTHLLGFQ